MFFFCRSLIDLRIPLTAHRLNTRWIFALTLIVKPRPHPEMLLFLSNVACNCSALSQLQEWMIFLLLFKDRSALSHWVTSLRDKNSSLQLVPFQTSTPPLQFFDVPVFLTADLFLECRERHSIHRGGGDSLLWPEAAQTNLQTWVFWATGQL